MKKGAALLIVVLFIAIFGAVMVTATRAGLLNGIFTNNTISAMIAEEASQAGLEIGLLHFKNNGIPAAATILCLDLENTIAPVSAGPCGALSATKRYAQVTLEPTNNLLKITSVGRYGHVVKKHTLTQQAIPW